MTKLLMFESYFISDFSKIEIVTPVRQIYGQGYGGFSYDFRINGIPFTVFKSEWDDVNQRSISLNEVKAECEDSRTRLIELIKSSYQ
jgi:hypothetical protein